LIGILALTILIFIFQKKDEKKAEELKLAIEQEAKPLLQKTEQIPAPKQIIKSFIQKKYLMDENTKNFLNFVQAAQTPEEVFTKSASYVLANQYEDRWVTQGDVLVDEKKLVAKIEDSQAAIMKLEPVDYWAMNIVPYEIDPVLDSDLIQKAVAAINKQTNIRFVERNSEKDSVYFRLHSEKACLSYLGKQGGEQDILINPEACDYGSILHEMMHAIGFIHEHSREDRDSYVDIHWDQIQEGAKEQFQKLSSDVWKPSGKFDFESLLLYPSQAFAISHKPSITKKDGTVFDVNRTHLSKDDIIKINQIYPAKEEKE
ncbi:MAG: M12 family metallopeptidase, partial [Oligoflexales bacterium]|nr:M12 family metallopeptidase [Oligoflexales bacterium]